MNTFVEILSPDFLLREALIGSVLVGCLCPLIGVYFVLRRMIFLGVALPQVSFAGKKHAHSAKTKKRAASCSGTLLPASPSVRPLGHFYVSGKACVKGTVKLQQALDGSWSGLGKTTANRNGSFSTCVALRDAAGSPSVQLRAVASNGSN